MICDACFGNEYKKPQMIFLGWGSGTVCPECYEYIKTLSCSTSWSLASWCHNQLTLNPLYKLNRIFVRICHSV